MNKIFRLLKKESGFPDEPIYAEKRLGEVYKIYLTNDKAREVLGWTPKVDLENGIKQTVAYYSG